MMFANGLLIQYGRVSGPIVNTSGYLGYVIAVACLKVWGSADSDHPWVSAIPAFWLLPSSAVQIAGAQLCAVLAFSVCADFSAKLLLGLDRFPSAADEYRANLKDIKVRQTERRAEKERRRKEEEERKREKED